MNEEIKYINDCDINRHFVSTKYSFLLVQQLQLIGLPAVLNMYMK